MAGLIRRIASATTKFLKTHHQGLVDVGRSD
jgi:hypothetical protein